MSEQRKYKVKIVSPVPYHGEGAMLLSVPVGECQVVEENMVGPFRILWHEDGSDKSTLLNLREWVIHVYSGAIKVVDEPDIP